MHGQPLFISADTHLFSGKENHSRVKHPLMVTIGETYSSYILAQKDLGVTDKLVQAQLGHADISTTHQAYYYNIFDEEEQVNVLSSIRIG